MKEAIVLCLEVLLQRDWQIRKMIIDSMQTTPVDENALQEAAIMIQTNRRKLHAIRRAVKDSV